MPMISPPGGAVDWPANEGILGVVGVAPWSTMEFLRVFYGLISASKDWNYPRVILDINTKLPSRGRHFELGESDFSPAIASTIQELADQGATVAVVICNTAHVLFDRWANDAPIPIPNIVDETARAAIAAGGRKLAILGSGSVARFGIYADAAARNGAEILKLTSEQQACVWQGIEQVKVNGRMDAEMNARFASLTADLKDAGADTFILGCTELSELKVQFIEKAHRVIDSNEALARAVLNLLNLPARLIRQ